LDTDKSLINKDLRVKSEPCAAAGGSAGFAPRLESWRVRPTRHLFNRVLVYERRLIECLSLWTFTTGRIATSPTAAGMTQRQS
jgi:hypothetical protein